MNLHLLVDAESWEFLPNKQRWSFGRSCGGRRFNMQINMLYLLLKRAKAQGQTVAAAGHGHFPCHDQLQRFLLIGRTHPSGPIAGIGYLAIHGRPARIRP